MDAPTLVAALSPPLDETLAEQLLDEFLDAERRFLLQDWEPATLDGGQFAEIASRIVYHIDSGNLNRTKGVNDCLKYVEDPTNGNAHAFSNRRASLHLCKVLRTLYKFRSQRGAVHIDPNYTANELDSSLVMALVRWVMCELLRLFWTADRQEVVRAIKEVVRFDVPAILTIDGRPLVVTTECTVEQEVLLLLHNAGEVGLTTSELSGSTPRSNSSVRSAVSVLNSARKREITKKSDRRYILTPNGSRRIREELADKLSF